MFILGAMAAETGNSANFLAHGPGGITGAHLIAGWADKGFEIDQFDANWDWAAANKAVWKYNGYYKTPQGKFAHVGTLTDTQTTMCAVHWLVFGFVIFIDFKKLIQLINNFTANK